MVMKMRQSDYKYWLSECRGDGSYCLPVMVSSGLIGLLFVVVCSCLFWLFEIRTFVLSNFKLCLVGSWNPPKVLYLIYELLLPPLFQNNPSAPKNNNRASFLHEHQKKGSSGKERWKEKNRGREGKEINEQFWTCMTQQNNLKNRSKTIQQIKKPFVLLSSLFFVHIFNTLSTYRT